MEAVAVRAAKDGSHDDDGEEIRERESEESGPNASKCKSDGGREKPVTVADPFTF